MGNVKVSKEVYDALNDYLINYDKETLIFDHCNTRVKWEKEKYKCLNEISILKMMEILINGYVFEETPEEKLENIFNNLSNNKDDMNFKAGIFHCLNTLKIKIKGINDGE